MDRLFCDDPVFPRTRPGQCAAGLILESTSPTPSLKGASPRSNLEGSKSAKQYIADTSDSGKQGIFESFADSQARSLAMSAVLSWTGDNEYTYTALDEYIVAVADLDGDFEITPEEENVYNDIWQQVPDAILTLGADGGFSEDDVERLVNGEEDAAAAIVGNALSAALEDTEADDDDLITAFAFGEDAVLESAAGDEVLCGILEAAYKKRKVMRNGKVQVVNKRVSGTVRRSSAQKMGLRKARRMSQTSTAKMKRRKSMKMRANRGL